MAKWKYFNYFEFEFGPEGEVEKYQKKSCETPSRAYRFAIGSNHANISYCQRHACKDSFDAWRFATSVNEADIEYCYNFASNDRKRDIERFVLKDL